MATKIKVYIAKNDIRQSDIAKKTGYSPSHISHIIAGDHYAKIPAKAMEKIAKALDTKVSRIF